MDKMMLSLSLIRQRNLTFILLIFAFLLQSCNSDLIINLGEGYFYRDEGGDIKDIHSENPKGGTIPSTVLSYSYNRDYIIAKQKPKLPQDPLYEKEYVYKNGGDTIYYWLIIKNKHLILGPLDKNEFFKTKEKYGILNDLSL